MVERQSDKVVFVAMSHRRHGRNGTSIPRFTFSVIESISAGEMSKL